MARRRPEAEKPPRRSRASAAWLVLGVLLTGAALAGCIGDNETADETADETDAVAITTTAPMTAMEGCPPGFSRIPCFEASVATDTAERIYVAPSVCTGIGRSTNATDSFEKLGLPPLPPLAPPTTTLPGDCTLDIGPEGDLYFSAFYFHQEPIEQAPSHYGIHVARSEDSGDSWATNTYLSPTTNPPTPALHPDRQWLSFGSDGRVYLTYWDFELDQSWIAVSNDRGASFGLFREMPGAIPGQPVAEGANTLHVPWLDRNRDEVRVSTSTDGGESFQTQTVAKVSSHWWWPDLALGPSNQLYITWVVAGDGGKVLVARETEDGGWTDPVIWNDGTRNATGIAPGIEVHDGFVDVVWYGHHEERRAYLVGRAPVESFDSGGVKTHVLGTYQAERTVSHFADMAVAPNGQGVFAWTDPDRGLLVAREVEHETTDASATGMAS